MSFKTRMVSIILPLVVLGPLSLTAVAYGAFRRVIETGLIEARDIILAERGSHFDPDIVDAFVNLFEEFCAIVQRFHADGA